MSNFAKLEENIDILSGISREGGLDISKYLLPDKEAVKKLISQRNPKMSKEDIDLLVDSEEESLRKDDELEEELKLEDDSEVEDLEFSDFDFRRDVVIGIPNIPISDEEMKIRQAQIEERREQKRIQREERKKERQRDREIRRENRRKRIRQIKENFKEQLAEFWKEVKDIKKKIIQAASDLFRGFKEMAKDLGMCIVASATSITAITIIFSTPPWNVAQAITIVIEIILSYLKLISKVQAFAPALFPLKLLPFVTDRKNLSIVSSILNPILESVKKLWIPISALNKVISNLIQKLKDLMGSDNKNKIFRRATRKLKKLGHIRKRDGTISFPIPDVGIPGPISNLLKGRGDLQSGEVAIDGSNIYSYDEEDVDEIRSLLDQFVLNGDGSSKSHKVVDFRVKFDDSLANLEKELEDVEIPVKVSDEDIENFIYDVTLPDGTVIKNISEEGIDYFRQNYILKFTNFTLP